MHAATTAEPRAMGLPISNGKLAMWLFLATEIMFFSGLIGGYIVNRFGLPVWPTPAQVHLVEWMGAVNTFVLICSSVTIVLAYKAMTQQHVGKALQFIFLTMALGGVFMVIKVVEYRGKYDHNVIPGRVREVADAGYAKELREITVPALQALADTAEQKAYVGKLEAFSKELTEGTLSTTRALRRARELEEEFHKVFGHSHEVHLPQLIPMGNLWASWYFTLTGIHALHVLGGMVIFTIMLLMAAAGKFGPERVKFVELSGLYWHFVDIVWIFLFPLLYLLG